MGLTWTLEFDGSFQFDRYGSSDLSDKYIAYVEESKLVTLSPFVYWVLT